MTQHMMRYKVRPGKAARNEELLRALFAELDTARPEGLRYAAFKLDDNVTFIHLISHEPAHGPGPLSELQGLRAFHEGLRNRCEEGPVRTGLSEIGSFGRVAED